MTTHTPKGPYTCGDYRQEMVLLALKKRLVEEDMTPEARRVMEEEVARLEEEMGMD